MTPSAQDLVAAAAEAFGVPAAQIMARGRRPAVARARQAAMWLAAQLTTLTYDEIGAAFRRDRTTIRHACATIDAAMASDAWLADRLDGIRGSFRGEDATLWETEPPAAPPATLRRAVKRVELALIYIEDGARHTARDCIVEALLLLAPDSGVLRETMEGAS